MVRMAIGKVRGHTGLLRGRECKLSPAFPIVPDAVWRRWRISAWLEMCLVVNASRSLNSLEIDAE